MSIFLEKQYQLLQKSEAAFISCLKHFWVISIVKKTKQNNYLLILARRILDGKQVQEAVRNHLHPFNESE